MYIRIHVEEVTKLTQSQQLLVALAEDRNGTDRHRHRHRIEHDFENEPRRNSDGTSVRGLKITIMFSLRYPFSAQPSLPWLSIAFSERENCARGDEALLLAGPLRRILLTIRSQCQKPYTLAEEQTGLL